MRSDRIKLIYLACPGHSGSTLLAFLLGAHPRIATVGELKVVPASFRDGSDCSCGVPLRECEFWARVNERLRRTGFDLGDPAFRTHAGGAGRLDRVVVGQVRGRAAELARSAAIAVLPAARQRWTQTIRCNAALMRAILDETGRPMILDTSKDASRLRYLKESGRFDIRVLHLVRDGRAVAWSLIRKGANPRQAAAEWVSEHEQAARLRARFGADRWLTFQYERLCEDPDSTLAEICRFLGIAADAALMQFRNWDSHILGNRMRLSREQGIRLDASWRSALDSESLAAVEAVVSAMNRTFGYA